MQHPQVRIATTADIPAMIALERASASAGHWTEEQYRDLFEPEASRLALVAVGMASGFENSDDDPEVLAGFLISRHIAPEWELENIVVDAAFRRMGIGKRLLDSLLTEVRHRNSESVFLEVRESNSAARGLYEKMGFRQTGRRPAYYSQPTEDAVLYQWKTR